MSLEISFHYRHVSSSLNVELADHLACKESFTLLGPRSIGKRYVLRKVGEELGRRGKPYLCISFDSPRCLVTEAEVAENLSARPIPSKGVERPTQWKRLDDFFEWLEVENRRLGQEIYLLLGNFGQLSETIAAYFVKQLRTVCDRRHLRVGLSGEGDLASSHEGRPSLGCEHNYVIQGLDHEVFAQFFERTLKRLSLKIADEAAFQAALFVHTGGDPRLLRHVLHTLALRSVEKDEPPLQVCDLPGTFLAFPEPRIWGFEAFGPMQKLIEAAKPKELSFLQKLVASPGGCPLPIQYSGTHGKPHALELMGVATRDVKTEAGVNLRFSSPYTEEFAREYLDPIRLGDLFAQNQNWDNAFLCYDKAPVERLSRPYSPSDHSQLGKLLQGLIGEMHRRIARKAEENGDLSDVIKLAVHGAKLLLGNTSATIWKFTPEGRWAAESGERNPKIEGLLSERFPDGRPLSQPVQYSESLRAYCILLEDPDQSVALVIDNRGRSRVPAGANDLTKQFVENLRSVWEYATRYKRLVRPLENQRDLLRATVEVFGELGRGITDVPGAMEAIADKLLELPNLYLRRLSWLLKIPGQNCLRLVRDRIRDKLNVTRIEDNYVVEINGEGQVFDHCFAAAIGKEDPLKYPNPHSDLRIPEEWRKVLRGMTYVVELRDNFDSLVGVMLIERQEQAPALPQSLETELVTLASRVSILIRHAERIDAFGKALVGIGDPIFIMDTHRRIRYATSSAGEKIGLASELYNHWLPPEMAVPTDQVAELKPMWHEFKRIIAQRPDQDGYNRSFFSPPQRRERILWNVTAIPLRDCQNSPSGHVVRMRDRTAVYEGLRALYSISASTDTTECLKNFIKAAQSVTGRRAETVRLYTVSPSHPHLLVSAESIGISDDTERKRFEEGTIRLDKRKFPEAWAVFKETLILPCCWQLVDELEPGGSDKEHWTRQGLQFRRVLKSQFKAPSEKPSSPFWLDFPLVVTDDDTDKVVPAGKISLTFDEIEHLPTPEAFETLSWIAQVTSKLLGGVYAQVKRLREEAEITEHRALAMSAHNLATKTAAISNKYSSLKDMSDDLRRIIKRADYLTVGEIKKRLTRTNAEFGKINRGFGQLLASVDGIMKRSKGYLRGVVIDEYVRVNLKRVLTRAAASFAGTLTVKIERDAAIWGDEGYLQMAFEELFRDSIAYFHGKGKPQIGLSISKENHRILLVYEDNGPGIPTEYKAAIFQPYFKMGHKRGGPGIGIGLFFVENVIKAHHGSIVERGVPGRGVKFVISIADHPERPKST